MDNSTIGFSWFYNKLGFMVKKKKIQPVIECWLIDCMVLKPFSTVYQLYRDGQCTYPFFPWVFLTSILHNILSKQLAAFPHNHRRNYSYLWKWSYPPPAHCHRAGFGHRMENGLVRVAQDKIVSTDRQSWKIAYAQLHIQTNIMCKFQNSTCKNVGVMLWITMI